jgi:hypothetical protein
VTYEGDDSHVPGFPLRKATGAVPGSCPGNGAGRDWVGRFWQAAYGTLWCHPLPSLTYTSPWGCSQAMACNWAMLLHSAPCFPLCERGMPPWLARVMEMPTPKVMFPHPMAECPTCTPRLSKLQGKVVDSI